MIYNREETAKEIAMNVAKQMVTAAITAPKGHGIDNLQAIIVDGKEKDALADQMRVIGEKTDTAFFIRDAGNVDNSHCVVLMAATNSPILLENCGYCGFKDCAANREAGACCSFNNVDLGIAIGSAVSIAADNRIDNRVLFSAGQAALQLGMFEESTKVCLGIPLSTTTKSIFFDRDPVD